MSEYTKIITNKGLELITSAAFNSGELVVKSIVIGDANGQNYVPTATQTSLINKRQELQISEMIVNSDTSYTFLAQIPQDIDYFIIREIGLIDVNDNLIEIAQIEQETYIQSDNLVQQLTIGIQIDVGQSSTVIVLADTNIETASKNYVQSNFQLLSEKNQANGYCPLDENAIVPIQHLPELNYANMDLSNLSATGEAKFANTTLSNTINLSDNFLNLLNQAITLNALTNVSNSFMDALNAANIKTIKKTYNNGSSGYRIYSDDFCIQWGFVSTAFSTTTVSFLKQMEDTNYLVLLSGITGSTIPRVTDNTLTTSSMGLSRQSDTNSRGWWCVMGYCVDNIDFVNILLGVNTSNTNYTLNGNYRLSASGQGSAFTRDNTYTLNTPITNCKRITFNYTDSHSTGHYVTTTVYVVDSSNNEIEVYSRRANWNVAKTPVSYTLSNITVKAIRIYTSVGVDVNGYHNSTTTIDSIQIYK